MARVAFLLLAVPVALGAQTAGGRPLPDADAFFAATRANMAAANKEQNNYSYKERRTELHMNPFGRIGSGTSVVVHEVTPLRGGAVVYRKLLERDGKPVPDSPSERHERRPRTDRRSPIDDAAAALRFTIDRRETINGREAIVVLFEPRPEARPQSREGKLAKVFKGTIWVDEAAHEVMRVEATAIDSISYGFGLVARLNEGTVVTLTRERADDRIWLPTSIRFMGQGRAMLFRRLNVDHAIEWFDYKRVN